MKHYVRCPQCGSSMFKLKSKLTKNHLYKCQVCKKSFNEMEKDVELEAYFAKGNLSNSFRYRMLIHLYLENCSVSKMSKILSMSSTTIYRTINELPEMFKYIRKESRLSNISFNSLEEYICDKLHPQFNYRFLCIALHADPNFGYFKSNLIKNGQLTKDALYPFRKSI